MPFIIDGHNLIPKIPGLSLEILDDEKELIELLINYNRTARKKILVYFDNAPAGSVRERRFGSLTAYFIRHGSSADFAIRAQLDQLGKRAKNWTVVSSDLDVQRSAITMGARVISSEEFARSMLDVLNRDADVFNTLEKNNLDEDDIEHWLKIFGRSTDLDEK